MSVGVGVIGIGGLGNLQAELLAGFEDVTLVGGADAIAEARESFRTDFDVEAYEEHEEMLAATDPDAVTVATPHTLHYEHASDALEADAHVHVEKPLTTDTADARELIELADSRDRLLQVGYQRHFHPAYREINRVIESGRIGEPHMAACYLGQDWIEGQEGTWRTSPPLSGGGQLIDSGSHLLDALLWTTDADPGTVTAVKDCWEYDVDVNSAISATLDRGSGTVIASIGVTGDGHGFEEHLSIWGTGGRLTYEGGELVVAEDAGQQYRTDIAGPGYRELTETKLEAFVEAVRTGGESPVPGECGLRVTKLTEAAFEAATTGRAVDAQEL